METNQQAILLLAAGASRRMGQPKQLLQYAQQPVISHLLDLLCRQGRVVYVVLGAAHASILPAITRFPVEIVINEQWELGMGTSLRTGLEALLENESACEQVLCLVVDQVFLSQEVLDDYWEFARSHDLIAAQYASGVIGVPALFGKAYFTELLAVAPHQGARLLLKRYATQVRSVSFPQGEFDLDYPADWAFFLESRRAEMDSEEE